MDHEELVEPAGLDTFHFAGIGNLFVASNELHITFWDWHRTPSGLLRFGVRRAICSPSIVPACAEAAFDAISTRTIERITRPFKLMAS